MKNKLAILAFCLFAVFIGWKAKEYQQVKDRLPSRKSLIQNELENKLEEYGSRMKGRCEEEMLKAAKMKADSIVFIKANELMLFDSIRRPEKPIKPDFPIKKVLKDSQEIAPLVEF